MSMKSIPAIIPETGEGYSKFSFFCDICDTQIDNLGRAMAAWEPGEATDVYHVHKGKCLDALDKILDTYLLTVEACDLPIFLLRDLGLTRYEPTYAAA